MLRPTPFRLARVWAFLALPLPLFGLIGQAMGWPVVAALGPAGKPMAPATALVALLLGLGLVLWSPVRHVRRQRHLALGLGWVAGLGALAFLAAPGAATRLLLRAALLGAEPLSRASWVSLTTVLVLAVAFLLILGPRRRPRRLRQAGALAALPSLGLMFLVLLSYGARVPLFYDTPVNPVAMPSALTITLLGLSLVTLAGRDTFPATLFRLEPVPEGPDPVPRPWLRGVPLVTFLLFTLAIALAGGSVLRLQTDAAWRGAHERLADIADLNKAQLATWLAAANGGREAPQIPANLLVWPVSAPKGELVLLRRVPGGFLKLRPGREAEAFAADGLPPRVLAAVRGGDSGAAQVAGWNRAGFGVLAAVREEPATGLVLVAQMDQATVVQALRQDFWITALAVLGMISTLGLGSGLLVKSFTNLRIREALVRERDHQVLLERARVVMGQANDCILLLDLDGRLVEVNERAEQAYGIPAARLRGMAFEALHGEDPGAGFQVRWQGLRSRGEGLWETWNLRADGRPFPVEISARVVDPDGHGYVIVCLRDISERLAQARDLRRLGGLYAALGQLGQVIAWSADPPALFLKACRVLVTFGGLRSAWVVEGGAPAGTLVAQAGPPEDPAGFGIATALQALQERRGVVREAPEGAAAGVFAGFPVQRAGRAVYALGLLAEDAAFFGTPMLALLEEVALGLSLALDKLAEEARRAHAEEELMAAKAFTENLIQTANTMIISRDALGRVAIFNDAAEDVTGYTRADLAGRNWMEVLIPQEQYPDVWERLALLGDGELPRNLETPIRTRSGEERYVRWQNNEIRVGGRVTGSISFGMDITGVRRSARERRLLEEQLQQSQKMESLGSLAGGVAHDLNNVLGAILSLASAHQAEADLPPRLAGSLETIVKACLRGRGVVKSLLYFARKDLEEARPLDLNALARDIVQLLTFTTLKRVDLALDLEEGLPLVAGDGGALSHALMNLCVNALDAMPGGGTLTLRSRRLADGGIALEVQDTGHGMPPEVLAKAMDPFFTTKPVGKGTGLGLAMVFGTLKAHGGMLDLESEAGRGTLARLRFPASRLRGPAEPGPEGPAAPAGPGRSLSVLLVDDDVLIRDSLGPVLQSLGHTVALASGGQEALDHLAGGLAPDLVILDMNMPGMNGAQALPRILDLRPGQTVLLASGYTDQDLEALVAAHPTVQSLRKPFSLEELQEAMAGV